MLLLPQERVYICRKQIHKLSNTHRICKFSSSLYESFQKGKFHPQTTETQVRHYNPASEHERTHFAPRLIKGSHLLLVLFQIVTSILQQEEMPINSKCKKKKKTGWMQGEEQIRNKKIQHENCIGKVTYPALRRLWAIGEPMIPMPKKPTRDGGSVTETV